MPNPTLQELNAHLFAHMMPETHGLDKQVDAPKAAAKGKKAAAPKADEQPQPVAQQYTAEQLEILKAAGIEDVAAADPQAVAAILGL